jgi:hypothetical protein
MFEPNDQVENPDGMKGIVTACIRERKMFFVAWNDGAGNWWDDGDPSVKKITNEVSNG